MHLRVCSLLLLFMVVSMRGVNCEDPTVGGGDEAEKKGGDGLPVPTESDIPEKSNADGGIQLPPVKCRTKNGEAVDCDSKEMKRDIRVLIYNPHMGHYHKKFMSTIAHEMHSAGYSVTVLSSLVDAAKEAENPLKLAEGIEELKVGLNHVTKEILDNGDKLDNGLRAFWEELSPTKKFWGTFGHYWKGNNFSTMMTAQCGDVIGSDEFKKLQKVEKFDLAITEVFDLCGLGLFHMLKPHRMILASSVPLHDYLGEKLGLPKSFDLVPPKFSLTLLEDLHKSFNELSARGIIENAFHSSMWGQNMFGYLWKEEEALFKEADASFPGFDVVLHKAHSLMENVHPLIDLSKPTLNGIIPIGGITVEAGKEIEESIRDELVAAKIEGKRRVLVSFGTVMDPKTMKKTTMQNVVNAMGAVENTLFLWKADLAELKKESIEIPENVKVYKWLAQNDLLASGHIDLFVSHMGIGSLSEAAYNGVPLVSIPIFVDQPYNAVCAIRLGITRYVNKHSLATSSEELTKAIKMALNDIDNSKKKSMQLSKNLKAFGDQRKKMMEHIEYVLTLPPNSESLTFFNHHRGFSIRLLLSMLVHAAIPYFGHIIVTLLVLIASTLIAMPLAYRLVQPWLREILRISVVNLLAMNTAKWAIYLYTSYCRSYATDYFNALIAYEGFVLGFGIGIVVVFVTRATWLLTSSRPKSDRTRRDAKDDARANDDARAKGDRDGNGDGNGGDDGGNPAVDPVDPWWKNLKNNMDWKNLFEIVVLAFVNVVLILTLWAF